MKNVERRGEWLEIHPGARELRDADDAVEILKSYLSVPEGLLRKWLRQGAIVSAGGRLRVRLFPEENHSYAPEWMNLEPLYEDDYCLVMNKPAGISVHPAFQGQGGTLANAVAAHYQYTGQSVGIRHIHRLDADTSGPVLYAKNEYAHLFLDDAMRRKAVERIYLAVVAGRMRQSSGTLDYPIGKDRHHPNRRRVSASGAAAVTRYEVVEQFRDAALVRVRLETGRTHQIRVHFSHIGHPLLGDRLYGGPAERISRQALHGEKLIFPHQLTRERVSVSAPLPDDIASLLERLREQSPAK